jgi:hypothetical protein
MIKNILFKTGKSPKIILLLLNLIFWISVWIVFIHASYPYQLEPTGEFGTTIFTFRGYSVMLLERGAVHCFWKAALYLEFPSYVVASLGARVIDPQFAGNNYFIGISESGWILISAMCLSFLQWYFIACLIQRFIIKFTGRGRTKTKHLYSEDRPDGGL